MTTSPTLPAPVVVPPVQWIGSDPYLEQSVRDHASAIGAALITTPTDVPTDISASPVVTVAEAAALGAVDPASIAHTSLVVVLRAGPVDPRVWKYAVEQGARAIVQLPGDEAELMDALSTLSAPPQSTTMIGVVAGHGGAGASTTAAHLAAAARSHGPSVLVDADPAGGGLDALVESPITTGVTWSDLGHIGASDAATMRAALPTIDQVQVLCAGSGTGPDPASLTRALNALSCGGGTVVVDLGTDVVPYAMPHLQLLLLVIQAHDHAVRTAQRRLDRWGIPRSSVGIVVRKNGPLPLSVISDDLDCPVVAAFRDYRGTVVPLLDRRRTGADAACRQLLHRMAAA